MSKTSRLESIHTHLAVRKSNYLQQLLRADQLGLSLATWENYTQCVGQATVMQAEIEDHCQSLQAIEDACQHGLAGTIPDGYTEDGYEFAEEPETPELPYDPYTDILGYLTGGGNISCLTLSPALLHFIERLPEVAADQAERDVKGKDRVLLRHDDNGGMRPMTKSELRRQGNRAVVHATEQSFFAATYADELRRIQEVAHARGDFQLILELLA